MVTIQEECPTPMEREGERENVCVLKKDEKVKRMTLPSPQLAVLAALGMGMEVCGKHFNTDNAAAQIGNNFIFKINRQI